MLEESNNYCHYSDLPSPMAYMSVREDSQYKQPLNVDRIIEMAWEDRTPFDAIKVQFGISEDEVKAVMKKNLRFSSYKLWRERVERCKTKHLKTRMGNISRFKSKAQRSITFNKLSKRK